jgi:Tfp pilus assembly protein PilO
VDKVKQWVLLTLAGCLAVLAAGWFLLVSPKHATAADLREQASVQEDSNATLRTELATLKAQSKNLPEQQARIAAVAAKIPADPAMPTLIRSLDAASADAGVELVDITPGAPVAPPAASAPTGLTTVPVALDIVGGYFEVQQFLSDLEGLTRAFRVTGLHLAPGTNPVSHTTATAPEDGRVLRAAVTGEVYVSTGRTAAPVTAPAAGSSTARPSTPTAAGPAGTSN